MMTDEEKSLFSKEDDDDWESEISDLVNELKNRDNDRKPKSIRSGKSKSRPGSAGSHKTRKTAKTSRSRRSGKSSKSRAKRSSSRGD
jgi:hypothetical protein